jgi:hypothetical protein
MNDFSQGVTAGQQARLNRGVGGAPQQGLLA